MSEAHDDQDLKLRRAVSALPRSVSPQRDLWPGIAARMTADDPAAHGDARSASRLASRRVSSWVWALAASVAGICIGVMVTLAVMRQQVAGNVPIGTRMAGSGGYDFVPASTDAVRLKMERDAYAQLARLAPKTRANVENDLKTITQALTDIQAALGHDPGNALLQDLLVSTYQDELNTLANVGTLARATHTEVSL